MNTPKEYAETWLETPGADDALELTMMLQHGKHSPAVKMTAQAVLMSFLEGWLNQWAGVEYNSDFAMAVYREVIEEGEKRFG